MNDGPKCRECGLIVAPLPDVCDACRTVADGPSMSRRLETAEQQIQNLKAENVRLEQYVFSLEMFLLRFDANLAQAAREAMADKEVPNKITALFEAAKQVADPYGLGWRSIENMANLRKAVVTLEPS